MKTKCTKWILEYERNLAKLLYVLAFTSRQVSIKKLCLPTRSDTIAVCLVTIKVYDTEYLLGEFGNELDTT